MHWTILNNALGRPRHGKKMPARRGARGKKLYESRCIGCHSIDENRAGPAHKGVFGRKAGSANLRSAK